MSSSKRKKGSSSGSDSQIVQNEGKQERKQRKQRKTEVVVSDILNQTNSILYDYSSVFGNLIIQELNIESQNDQTETETKMSDPTMSAKLDTLIEVVKDLKTSQDGMKRMFESKLDKLRSDLMANVDTKVRTLRDELSLDIGRQTARTDQMLITIQSMQTRLDDLEQRQVNTHATTVTDSGNGNFIMPVAQVNPLDNVDLTITASGIKVTESENLVTKANDLIRSLGEDVSSNVQVTAATRLPTRFNDRPGIVKISFRSTEEKVRVLRNKMKLKDSEEYKHVYIKSSKSRIERLIETNARAV